jgi:Flp pilus assembly protein TadD
MNPNNPLASIYYIEMPENFIPSENAFKIDTTIKLPVQKKVNESSGNFNPSEISTEQILAGMLTVLAYDKKNEHLEYYRSIIRQLKPNIKKELCEAAILKAKNEDFDLAEEIFLALNGFDPEDKAIILNMALFLDQRADSYRKAGLNDDADAYDSDALSYYLDAMDTDPPLPDAYFNAGFYYMKKHSYKEAKDAFESFIALTCDVSDEELGENGVYKKERAQEIVNYILEQNIDDENYKAAYDLISNGQEEKGLDKIRQFLQTNPKVWNAWFLLGWALRKLNRFDDAKTAFLEAVKFGGNSNCDTYNELALCYIQLEEFAEAKKALETAMGIDPENTKVISNMGYLSLALGDKDAARKYFTVVLEIDPKDKIAANELLKLEQEV